MRAILLGLAIFASIVFSERTINGPYSSSVSLSDGYDASLFDYYVAENAKEVSLTLKINNPEECGGLDLMISTKNYPCSKLSPDSHILCANAMKFSVKKENKFEFNPSTPDKRTTMQWKVEQNWYFGVSRNQNSGSGVCSFTIIPTLSQTCGAGEIAKYIKHGLGKDVVCASEVTEETNTIERRSVSCASSADGFYCNANGGYTWCVGGRTYNMNCALGSSCNCGTDVYCPTPCTQACEAGSPSAATTFCNLRMGSFDISTPRGYFCDGNGAYYECIRDTFCPNQASPRSQKVSCAAGTSCSCNNPFQECLSVGNRTHPCSSTNVPECTQKLDCANSNDVQFCGDTRSCNRDIVDPLNACFWHAGSNNGVCAENFSCDTGTPCSTDSQCPDGYICAIKSCCGTGICAAVCGY